jgi:predicted molibdopterin-dependent oxidoreductase YjgC
MMVELKFISCPTCKKDYMVGIGDKDLRNATHSGGKVDGIPYIAIGNDEIESAPAIKSSKTKCHICGTECDIKSATSERKSG